VLPDASPPVSVCDWLSAFSIALIHAIPSVLSLTHGIAGAFA